MSATRLLVELIGHIVLLLWGARMVQTGIVRAFGGQQLHEQVMRIRIAG